MRILYYLIHQKRKEYDFSLNNPFGGGGDMGDISELFKTFFGGRGPSGGGGLGGFSGGGPPPGFGMPTGFRRRWSKYSYIHRRG